MAGERECRALVVGIDDYRGGIARLRSAVADARAVATALERDHGYRVECLADATASRSAMLEALARCADESAPEEGFVLYFAGHGLATGDGEGGPRGFLLPQDAEPGDESTWLSMQALRDALNRFRCGHLLVVLDCCFAGAFRWSATRDAVLVGHPLYDSQLARYLEGDSWLVLTSASHDQRAADTLPGRCNTRDGHDGPGHSPFAAAFLEALGGAADSARRGFDPDGVVTATELHQFVFETLVPPGASPLQTPGLWPLRPDNRGEFVFRCPGSELKTRPDPPLDEANNPWLGLRAYGPADAPLFFGRERVIEALEARIRGAGAGKLLVVVGASGTGKSSVVRAGLLPRLQGDWRIVECERLRADPLDQLARAQSRLETARTPNQPSLLLVDQFEELYTQCSDSGRREAFLAELERVVLAPDGPQVVLTLRSDFEPRLAACPRFGGRLGASRFVVPVFTPVELRRVIEGPLRARALFLDPPELVDTLLGEVAAMPGALPLLSFALAETYRLAQLRRRQTGSADRALTAADYAATGGVIGGLHRRASALHHEARPELQAMIRWLFLRLVAPDGARMAKRRVSFDELQFKEDSRTALAREAVDLYVEARLLIVDDGHVEPAHDSLVQAWEDLQDWLAAHPEQPLLRALWRSARDWQSGGFGGGLLWDSDPRLPHALAALPELNLLERRFAHASRVRRGRRRRVLAAATLSTMLLLAVAAVISWERAEEAERQRLEAERQLAEARYANGRALLEQARGASSIGDHVGAAFHSATALGFRNFGIEPGSADGASPAPLLVPEHPEHRDAIEELTRARQQAYLAVAWRPLGLARFTADATRLVGVNQDGDIELRDFAADRLALLESPLGRPEQLALSEDGEWLAASGQGRTELVLWQLGEGLDVTTAPRRLAPPEGFEAMAFDPQGQRLAAAGLDELRVWSLGEAEAEALVLPLYRTEGPARLTSLAFTEDGGTLYGGGFHDRILRFTLPPASRTRPDPSQVGRASIGPDWTLWSENIPKGDYVRQLRPDGQYLLAASANRLLMAQQANGVLRFAEQPVYSTRYEMVHFDIDERSGLFAVVDREGLRVFRPGSDATPAMLRPLGVELSRVRSLQLLGGPALLLVASDDRMELIDLSTQPSVEQGPDPEEEAAALPPADNVAALRALHESGQLDLLALGFPDPATRPAGLDMLVSETEDGLAVNFGAPDPQRNGDLRELGEMELALSGGSDPLLAVAFDRFRKRDLRPGGEAEIEVYRLQSEPRLVFVEVLWDLDAWGIDRLRFDESGQRLRVVVSNFDGYLHALHNFPMQRPDLARYVDPAECQAPFNLPAGHPFTQTRLLDCGE
ncbi:caspase family protein [Pseudomarimonas salicorniae]|uniref:Caspase family protein n=1 Tax=Pseudomarimonas salicorniae TaxID=2933270 RepID=A0ABT0GJC6_9GAMM|nr:caspase family protein [Lysobacter sp. CAU 1642]MCK7594640.1 caspase family protein [Lysobacter sp. CAU 1642]